MIKRVLVPAFGVMLIVAGLLLATQIHRNARVIESDTLVPVYERADETLTPGAYLAPGVVITVNGRSSNNQWYHVMTQSGLQGWVLSNNIDLAIELLSIPVILQNGEPSDIRHPLPDAVVDNIRSIYRTGQQRGRNPHVFAKVGDSITVSQSFMHPIGAGLYTLGEYPYLEETIQHYIAAPVRAGNSFTVKSAAAEVGWASGAVLDPNQADPNQCSRGETPLACELRVTNASVALIMLGTNDTGFIDEGTYRANLEAIVGMTVEAGVIPILSTIPPRSGFEAKIAGFNAAVREVADQYRIPLWDYGTAMSTLPAYGLTSDNIHPSSPPAAYNDAANFTAANLRYGYVLRNLTGLQMLDSVYRYLR